MYGSSDGRRSPSSESSQKKEFSIWQFKNLLKDDEDLLGNVRIYNDYFNN